MAKLPPKVHLCSIPMKARSGSPEDLEELAKLLTTENYTLAALDAALAQLDIDDIGNCPSPITSDLPFLRRIISAIEIVDQSLRLCRQTTELKAETSLRVQEHLDSLIAWMSFTITQIRRHRVYSSVGVTLLHLVASDDELRSSVFSSPAAANLILTLWRYEPPDINDESPESLEGNQIFCDTVLSSRRQLSVFLDAFLVKLRLLLDLFHPITQQGRILDKHADSLTAIFLHLERRTVLLEAKRYLCLKELAAVTSIFLPPLIPRNSFLGNSLLIFHFSRSRRRFSPVVESGLLEALVNVFPTCDWGGEAQICRGELIIALLASTACHPRGLKEISGVTLRLLERSELHTENNPWYCLATSVEQKLAVFSSLSLDILTCDNGTCPCTVSVPSSHPPVKVCSGCQFMTYCSTSCQKSDWTARHRFECAELRYVTQSRHNALRVSQRTKAFYLSLATEIFNDVKFQELCESQTRSAKRLNLDGNDLIITHDMTYQDFPKKTLGIRSWDEWHARTKPCLCSTTQSRLSSFVQEIRSRDKSGRISALDLKLEWNSEHYLYLLVHFVEVSEGLFRPSQSLLRFLRSEVPGPYGLDHGH
ncbi:hypothetical protein BKA70DRAFT_1462068 [Coprinopsis sp. MPI-PUGE-AT-0042]|nr:hypothetical protein BKA70DRAFT_1462068 [Coprinopsis sp. MPI-PUGE-AT-0042]